MLNRSMIDFRAVIGPYCSNLLARALGGQNLPLADLTGRFNAETLGVVCRESANEGESMSVPPAVSQRVRRVAVLTALACAVAVPASASASTGSVTHLWASSFVATTPAPSPTNTGAYTWTWSLSSGNAAGHGPVIGTDTWSCNNVVANEGGGTCVVHVVIPGSTVTSALQLLASDTDNATLAGATGTGIWKGIQTGAVLLVANPGAAGASGAADVTVLSDVSGASTARLARPATMTRFLAYNPTSVFTDPNPTDNTPVATTWDLARGTATHHSRVVGTWTTVCYGEHVQFAIECNSESVVVTGSTLVGAAQPFVPEGLLGGPLGSASLFSLGGATGTGVWAKTQGGVITSLPVGAGGDASLTVITY
jgi:hypothetical protein